MIKLVVNPHKEPTRHIFNKPVVIIGDSKRHNVDLSFSQENLEPIHVKIEEQNGRFIATNEAHDPFVTLNGIPFGKKFIFPNDILEIGSTQIQVEELVIGTQKDRGVIDTAKELPELLDRVLMQKSKEAVKNAQGVSSADLAGSEIFFDDDKLDFNLEQELEQLDKWFKGTDQPDPTSSGGSDLNADITREKNEFFNEPVDQPAENEENNRNSATPFQSEQSNISAKQPVASSPPPYKQTIKDLYFKDAEDSDQQDAIPAARVEQPAVTGTTDWHTIWTILFGIVAVITLIALLLYANASGKSEDEELRTAESVADVAMALAYAQLNNIVPQNQNWSDPEFLKNNLTAALSSQYPAFVHIDSHGQFINSPYLLRIYTDSDLSNFLIIAQPVPNLLHWLIPRSTIIVYSKDMELRKTLDLKTLNRILINSSLDGAAANEVSLVASKAKPIDLSSISKRQQKLGFSPPKALALMRPGAENKIYNAPRYHRFGESVLIKALALSENKEDTNEILLLKNEIDTLKRYPDFVMYSSKGMKSAIEAQKALAVFDSDTQFLIAYLQYNTQGAVQSSHLLMDNSPRELAEAEIQTPLEKKSFREEESPWERNENKGRNLEKSVSRSISEDDVTHPLFFQLSSLSASRQQALKPISREIIALLETENRLSLREFEENLQELSQKYLVALAAEEVRITKAITVLYQEYPNMSLLEFTHYVSAAGLDTQTLDNLKSQVEKLALKGTSKEIIDQQLEKIDNSISLKELEIEVLRANALFVLENVPNPDLVIDLQNKTRNATLKKIDTFILSQNSNLPADAYNEENVARVERILRNAWIRNPEEIEYYLNEFKLLVNSEQEESAGHLEAEVKPEEAKEIEAARQIEAPEPKPSEIAEAVIRQVKTSTAEQSTTPTEETPEPPLQQKTEARTWRAGKVWKKKPA